jgi:hypothetical protein
MNHRTHVSASSRSWLRAGAALLSIAAWGCGDDSGSTPTAGTGGGAGNGGSSATLTQVVAIFQSKACGACHSSAPSSANGGLQFDPSNKSSLHTALVGKKSAGTNGSKCGGMTYVEADEPSSSLLYQKLSGSPPCGVRMPQGGTPLSESELATVSSWIQGGALND